MAGYVPFEERHPERFPDTAPATQLPKSQPLTRPTESKESSRLKTDATVALWVWVSLAGLALLILAGAFLLFFGLLGAVGHAVSQGQLPMPPHP
jgi:hypothetical protein